MTARSSWPRLWQHKETKKQVRAMPWWEMPEPLDLGIKDSQIDGQKVKIGALVQIGWLLENENGVWFGLGLNAAEHFEDITPTETKPPESSPPPSPSP